MGSDLASEVSGECPAGRKGPFSAPKRDRPGGVGGRKAWGGDSCRCPETRASSPAVSGGVFLLWLSVYTFPALHNVLPLARLVHVKFLAICQRKTFRSGKPEAISSWSHVMCILQAHFQSFQTSRTSTHVPSSPSRNSPFLPLKNKSANGTPSASPLPPACRHGSIYWEILHFSIPQSSLNMGTASDLPGYTLASYKMS